MAFAAAQGPHTSFRPGQPIAGDIASGFHSAGHRRFWSSSVGVGRVDIDWWCWTAGDGRNLLGDNFLAAADRHDGGHEPISTSKHFYFRKPNQLELSRQDS